MGATQRAWFLDTMKASTRTFKVWGNEVCMMPRHIDLSANALAPEALRIKITISAEDWDGFPNERNALLGHLNAACATFNNGNVQAGIQQLQLFQVRVNNKIAPNDPALAQTLIQSAQDIIDAVQ